MDKIKIDNFRKVHHGVDFPKYVSLDTAVTKKIQSLIAQKLGLEIYSDGLALVRKIDSLGELCAGIDAASEEFSLRKALFHEGIKSSGDVYVNWYRYDTIDKIGLDDFDRYFDDVWYPSVDDIDVFDDSLAWVLSVSHDGKVKMLKM